MNVFRLVFLFLLFWTYSSAQVIDSTRVIDSKHIHDSSGFADSTALDSTTITKSTRRDTIVSVSRIPFDNYSEFTNKGEINFSDYRYSGNIFSKHPFSFLRDMGFAGNPSELYLYGRGFDDISFLSTSGLLNDRNSNSFDSHLLQSELIDSIEFVPLPRGFLYGGWNSVAVNFINKEVISRTPKTRIRYYEGSFGEAMIDGQAFLMPYKKLNLFFDVTNQISGERFRNTSFGMWTATAGAYYYANDKLTLFADYYYHKGNVSLNGGIDYAKILSNPSAPSSLLYDEIGAPVIFETQYNRKTSHKFTAGFRTDIIDRNLFELKILTSNTLDEFRNNENDFSNRIYNDYKNRFNGISVTNKYDHDYFSLNVNGGFEVVNIASEYNRLNTIETEYSDYSLSGVASLKLADTAIIPSVFGRILNRNGDNLFGAGADLRVQINKLFRFYAGLSIIDKKPYSNTYFRGDYKITNSETGIEFESENITIKSALFASLFDEKKILFGSTIDTGRTYIYSYMFLKNQIGISLSTIYRISKFSLNFKFNQTLSKLGEKYFSLLPLQIQAGVYYTDRLFDDNLLLNAGLNFSLIGKQVMHKYMIERPGVLYEFDANPIPINYTLDFIVQGEIQESAIVYFTMENLLDRKYFITPYYPMPLRGFRFGIAWNFLN
ncbi:MAG: hypothetical protein KF721_05305 [Ignavibacteriaceae bacterium]|nr:hypothetical protein [Ignavibacteriaceae bacterium]